MTLFVDTSIFYAVADRADRGNARAKALIDIADRVLTTDDILVETWLLMQRRLGRSAADRFWSGVQAGAISIVDRTSFAVMQRRGVLRVASFDSDFAIYRFGSRRERAFEVMG